jgi:uncharacterized small protein (DUF1192 family)
MDLGVMAGQGVAMQEPDEPRAPSRALAKLNLDPMGVDELRAYIAGLRAEIARAEAEIARKEGHRSAAESVFRMP